MWQMTNAHKCYLLLPFLLLFKRVLFSQLALMFFLVNNIKNFTCRYEYRQLKECYDCFYFPHFAYLYFFTLNNYLNNKNYFKNSFINMQYTAQIEVCSLLHFEMCIHETIITIEIMSNSITPKAFSMSFPTLSVPSHSASRQPLICFLLT